MFFKKEALQKIGLFDENTFLGWEEYIIAEKLFKNRYDTYAIPESVIYHKASADTKRIEHSEKTIIFLKSENYFLKYYLKMSYFQRLIIKIVKLIIYVILFLFVKSYRKNFRRIVNILFEIKNE